MRLCNPCATTGDPHRSVTAIPSISNQTVWMQLDYRSPATGQTGDPTGFPVEMAFTARNTLPQEADWKAASWEPDPDSEGMWQCRIEVGPGSPGPNLLTPGPTRVWARVGLPAETPVIPGPLFTVL